MGVIQRRGVGVLRGGGALGELEWGYVKTKVGVPTDLCDLKGYEGMLRGYAERCVDREQQWARGKVGWLGVPTYLCDVDGEDLQQTRHPGLAEHPSPSLLEASPGTGAVVVVVGGGGLTVTVTITVVVVVFAQ